MILGVAPWQQLLRQVGRAAVLRVAAMAGDFPAAAGMAAAEVAVTPIEHEKAAVNLHHRGF